MKLNKKIFKSQYSEYRKHVRKCFNLGFYAYKEAINTNRMYRECYIKTVLPVSVKIAVYKMRN